MFLDKFSVDTGEYIGETDPGIEIEFLSEGLHIDQEKHVFRSKQPLCVVIRAAVVSLEIVVECHQVDPECVIVGELFRI